MESRGARFAVLTVAVAAVVVLFVVLSGGDDEDATTTAAQTTTTEQEPGGGGDEPDKEKPKPEPEPEVPTVEVRGGQPVGGVQKLEFVSGERILFKVSSDANAVFHLHGYDVEQSVQAGGATTFDLAADIEGVFELEDHETLAPIAEVTVAPS